MDDTLLWPPRDKEDEEFEALRDKIFPPGFDYMETTKEEEIHLMKKLSRYEGHPPDTLNEEHSLIEMQRDAIVRGYGDGKLIPKRHEFDSFRFVLIFFWEVFSLVYSLWQRVISHSQ
jgi:hypothetical protein